MHENQTEPRSEANCEQNKLSTTLFTTSPDFTVDIPKRFSKNTCVANILYASLCKMYEHF